MNVTFAMPLAGAQMYTPPGGVNRTVASKLGEVRSVTDDGAVGDFSTDCTAAFTAAISRINTSGTLSSLYIPSGVYVIAGTLPKITRRCRIFGDGWRNTILRFTAAGQALVVSNAGFADHTVEFNDTGNTAFTAVSQLKSGVVIEDLSVEGDRSVVQDGIVFEGDCGLAVLNYVMVNHFAGRGILVGQAIGSGATLVRGQLRNTAWGPTKVWNCGRRSDHASGQCAAVEFIQGDSTLNPNADSTNMVTIPQMEIVFPFGIGLNIEDQRTDTNGVAIRQVVFPDLMLHGRLNAPYNTGALLQLKGDLFQIEFPRLKLYYNGFNAENAVLITRNATNSRFPTYITLGDIQMNVYTGIRVEYGNNINMEFLSAATFSYVVNLISTYTGRWRIERKSTFEPFMVNPGAFTLNGTNAVACTSMSTSTSQIYTFMPAGVTTLLCMVDNVIGTLTRVGTIPSETYTFTPAASSTQVIPVGAEWTKFRIDASAIPQGSGNWRMHHGVQDLGSTIPPSGTYPIGWVRRNCAPVIADSGTSDYVTTGWVKVTSGAANVLNTDWAPMRTLTGT